MYQRTILGLDQARAALDAVLAAAAGSDPPIVVTVVDPDGERIASARDRDS